MKFFTSPFWIVFVIFISITGCVDSSTAPSSSLNKIQPTSLKNTTALNILFIGSSYFNWNNMTEMLNNLCIQGGKNVNIEKRCINGKSLSFHASSQETLDKIDEKAWDYVVLQGAGFSVAYYDDPRFNSNERNSIMSLYNYIKDKRFSAQVIYQAAWAFEDGLLWIDGETDDYFDMQQKIFTNTIEWCRDTEMIIAPVGWAFYKVMLENNELHYLYDTDYNHPSPRGSYLMASVFYSLLFYEDCSEFRYYSNIPYQEAEYLLETGAQTVLNSFDFWHYKTGSISSVRD